MLLIIDSITHNIILVYVFLLTTVTFSLQQELYTVCEDDPLGMIFLCADLTDGELTDGVTVIVSLTSLEQFGSDAQGIECNVIFELVE